jgi:flavin reductase (DIM6/NTAB) family NADH-FMN oxidoreductase RutF
MPSGAMSFKEADLVIECKKLLSQPIDTSNITSSDVMNWYREEPGVHNIFFGEIIGVWKK